jgi:sugar phosphate isomerase/epimerase
LADGSSPFLCSTAAETDTLMKTINHPRFGLLLDTAHLKVSAQTMNFSADAFIKQNEKWVKAVHHSDNDGTIDNNKPLDANYWFLPYMPRFSRFTHVIEVNNQSLEEAKTQIALLQNAATVPA